MDPQQMLEINQAGWDAAAPKFVGATALPDYGPFAPSEDNLQLLGNLAGTRVLELGCGSGHSLLYLAQHGVTDLWGLDLAPAQIAYATTLLQQHGVVAQLFTSPMERNPGLPAGSFDLVVSLYALGWTTHLEQTVANVACYLRPQGRFVFSWEHPFYGCLQYEADQFVVARSYQSEGAHLAEGWNGVPMVRFTRKLSTYLNALAAHGLVLERLLEPAPDAAKDDSSEDRARYYSHTRAELVPATFIVCARKR